jgi:ABC-2 type transport system ATP-binding protein
MYNIMQNSSNSQIILDGVSHTYRNGTRALDNVSLEIETGLFGLLGSNGAGKSTLMRIICTLIQPSVGSITVAGFDVMRDRKSVRSILGYLPQDFGAWRGKSVSDSLNTFASLSGMTDKVIRAKRVEEVLESVGLSKVASRKVKQLSGGMVRRLGVAQALVHNPKVIIMDEPTVGLDPEERLRFRKLIADLGRDHIVVLSTHIIADLGASCSKIAMIEMGKLEFHGSPSELVAKAKKQVFEMSVPADKLSELEISDDFEIVARTMQNRQHLIRGVAKPNFTLDGASYADNITLEEAHLAFSMANGKNTERTHQLEEA